MRTSTLALLLLPHLSLASPVAEIAGSCPGVLDITVADATPGGAVVLLWSEGSGPTTLPAGAPACAGTQLDVDVATAQVLAIATADPTGAASASISVGTVDTCSSASGVAVDVATCAQSLPAPACGTVDGDGDGVGVGELCDCDDGDASVHPGAVEQLADGVDQDCDGREWCFLDADQDGFGSPTLTIFSADADCSDPGESLDSTDCDDSNPSTYPGAPDPPGGVDSDCDGYV